MVATLLLPGILQAVLFSVKMKPTHTQAYVGVVVEVHACANVSWSQSSWEGRQSLSFCFQTACSFILKRHILKSLLVACFLPFSSVFCFRECIIKASPKQFLYARYRAVSSGGSEGLGGFPAVSPWEVRESKKNLLLPYPKSLLNAIMSNSIVWLLQPFFPPANLLEQYVFLGSITAD